MNQLDPIINLITDKLDNAIDSFIDLLYAVGPFVIFIILFIIIIQIIEDREFVEIEKYHKFVVEHSLRLATIEYLNKTMIPFEIEHLENTLYIKDKYRFKSFDIDDYSKKFFIKNANAINNILEKIEYNDNLKKDYLCAINSLPAFIQESAVKHTKKHYDYKKCNNYERIICANKIFNSPINTINTKFYCVIKVFYKPWYAINYDEKVYVFNYKEFVEILDSINDALDSQKFY